MISLIAAGVDTHKDFHILALTDELGRELSVHRVCATKAGYEEVVRILGDVRDVIVVEMEGTGSYGSGLCAHLTRKGYPVSEVCRPKRERRRPGQAKTDGADALRAARDALRDLDEGRIPKERDGWIEAARVIKVAHDSAVKARSAHMVTLKNLIVTAPDPIRERLRHLGDADLIATCARKRSCQEEIIQALWDALRTLALLWRSADDEAHTTEDALSHLISRHAPALLSTFGIGPLVAATLATTAGENIDRLTKGEASFAALCGVNPVPAESGKTQGRHRLNRGGDRKANAALHTIAIVRMRFDEDTKAYVAKKMGEGKTKRDAIRCLKRHIAREVYKLLRDPFGKHREPYKKRA